MKTETTPLVGVPFKKYDCIPNGFEEPIPLEYCLVNEGTEKDPKYIVNMYLPGFPEHVIDYGDFDGDITSEQDITGAFLYLVEWCDPIDINKALDYRDSYYKDCEEDFRYEYQKDAAFCDFEKED